MLDEDCVRSQEFSTAGRFYLCAGAFLAAGANLLLQLRGATRAQLMTAFLIAASMASITG